MAQFDLPADELATYRGSAVRPPDFDSFWDHTLAEARSHPMTVSFVRVDTGLPLLDTYDVTFPGWGGQPIKAWLALPAGQQDPVPAVVEYVGYNGGRGLAHEVSFYALAGWAHLRMDSRGQGTGWHSGWSAGETPDLGGDAGSACPGNLTRGILDPEGHYFRRLFTDAVRAVDAVRSHPLVRADRIAVTGASQGGGIAVAVGGLVPDLAAVAPDVPFLCDFRRATTLVDSDPYGEIVRYCRGHRDQVEQVFATLDYLDGVNHAARGTAPSLWSAGLMDDVCPPSTVHAACNAWPAAKEIVDYPFNCHEGGGPFHEVRRLAFLHEILDA